MAITLSLGQEGQLLATIPGPHGASKTLPVSPDLPGMQALLALLDRQRLWGTLRPWLDATKPTPQAVKLPPRDRHIHSTAETLLAIGALKLSDLGLGQVCTQSDPEA